MRDLNTYLADPIFGSFTVLDALIALGVIIVIMTVVNRYKRSRMLKR